MLGLAFTSPAVSADDIGLDTSSYETVSPDSSSGEDPAGLGAGADTQGHGQGNEVGGTPPEGGDSASPPTDTLPTDTPPTDTPPTDPFTDPLLTDTPLTDTPLTDTLPTGEKGGHGEEGTEEEGTEEEGGHGEGSAVLPASQRAIERLLTPPLCSCPPPSSTAMA